MIDDVSEWGIQRREAGAAQTIVSHVSIQA